MTKPQQYILLGYAIAMLIITIYVPFVAQKLTYVGQFVQTEIVYGNYAFFWNLPNSFELAAMYLDQKLLTIEIVAVMTITCLLLYRFRDKKCQYH